MIGHRFYLHTNFLNLSLTLAESYSRFMIGNYQDKVYYD